MDILGALIAQAASFYTTLAFVALFTRPGDDLKAWLWTVGIALALEVLLFRMKERLWRKGAGQKAIGVLGFVGDGTINAGGLAGIASGLLLFGPVALGLGALEVNLADPGIALIAVVVTSFVLGLILSVLPHVLWRGARPRAGATT